MKSKQVLKLLQVSRVTLSSYVKSGLIKATRLANGYFDYHDDSVYSFLGKDDRINIIYARVSTYKQKGDLKRQINKLAKYYSNNDIINKIFSDISLGIDLDRKYFTDVLELVFEKS